MKQDILRPQLPAHNLSDSEMIWREKDNMISHLRQLLTIIYNKSMKKLVVIIMIKIRFKNNAYSISSGWAATNNIDLYCI